ncbi:MAG: transcriptional repressor [Spirochaetia bacterium]|jgi:Fe2+ or Zn2+ uptake regulation protein|nr:transcriptional repressor [Spirochaetia bacterium]
MVERRQTIQRGLVLDAVIDLFNHPTAHEVYEYIHKTHPSVGKATVYRNLNLLVDEGKLKRVFAIDGPDHYDSTTEVHQHLECKICKKVIDVSLSINDDNFIDVEKQTGFSDIDRNIIITGICPECLEKANK